MTSTHLYPVDADLPPLTAREAGPRVRRLYAPARRTVIVRTANSQYAPRHYRWRFLADLRCGAITDVFTVQTTEAAR